jgi:hypothetical protein
MRAPFTRITKSAELRRALAAEAVLAGARPDAGPGEQLGCLAAAAARAGRHDVAAQLLALGMRLRDQQPRARRTA